MDPHLELAYIQALERDIARVVDAEHAILKALGLPVDEVVVHEILSGKRPHRWRKKTAARDQQKANHAMFVLSWLGNLRGAALHSGEASRAASIALQIGLYAGNSAINALTHHQQNRGGHVRGEQKTQEAAKLDADVLRLLRRREQSDELQEQHPTDPAYIRKTLKLAPSTARRAVKRVKSSRRR